MQYSLKSLFVATAVVAVLFALACTLPDVLSIPVLAYITLILPGVTIALIVYARGYVQAFAIGCAVSPVGPAILAFPFIAASALPMIGGDDAVPETALYVKIGILGYHFLNISCGLVAVIARWCVLRSKHNNSVTSKVVEELVVERIVPLDSDLSAVEPFAIIQGRVRPTEGPELPSEDLRR